MWTVSRLTPYSRSDIDSGTPAPARSKSRSKLKPIQQRGARLAVYGEQKGATVFRLNRKPVAPSSKRQFFDWSSFFVSHSIVNWELRTPEAAAPAGRPSLSSTRTRVA